MLHTVNKSPHEKSTLWSCLRIAQSGSDILLIEDGVYAAMANSQFESQLRDAIRRYRIFALKEDLVCRGLQISKIIPGIQTIDYRGFVQLAVKNNSVHSWF